MGVDNIANILGVKASFPNCLDQQMYCMVKSAVKQYQTIMRIQQMHTYPSIANIIQIANNPEGFNIVFCRISEIMLIFLYICCKHIL